jgi:hypothetical protein
MEYSYLAAAIVLVAALAGGAYIMTGEEKVNCETQYDRLLNDTIDSTEITEQCRPIPEDIQNQVLAEAFQG